MMTDIDNPIVDEFTLRKDLYLLMSLLLADSKMKQVPKLTSWTKSFHENEVQKLVLWMAGAMRTRLDLLRPKDRGKFNERDCGEYWAEFPRSGRTTLTFRQACNSVIHAKEILPYKAGTRKTKGATNRGYSYSDRITVRSTHEERKTRAQIDIIRFVKISDNLIEHLRGTSHANR